MGTLKTRTTTGKPREIQPNAPLVPQKVFITRGVGVHEKELTSRELAMTNAGVEKMNMIKASSIIPPGCEFISIREAKEQLIIGQMAFAILAQCSTNEPFKRVTAAIGIAKPDDPEAYGFFTEIEEDQGYGKTEEKAGEEVMYLAISNLAMSWRAKWNDKMFDPKKSVYRIKNKIVRLSHMTQSVTGDKDGKYTTAFVAAVFIF
jgi:arginine decarboxylase